VFVVFRDEVVKGLYLLYSIAHKTFSYSPVDMHVLYLMIVDEQDEV